MPVYDQWHLAKKPKDPKAKKCSAHRDYPSKQHGNGLRWQVRGEDQDGKPFRQSFEWEVDAKDKDAELRTAVRAGTFVDERAGTITFKSYAETWRRNRVHDPATRERIRSAFENHCYESTGDRAVKGKTVQGGNAIGDYPMRALARRVSIIQGWIASLPMHANTALLLIKDVSQVFQAACDDKIIGANPLAAKSVQRPEAIPHEAVAWDFERIEAVAAELPEELRAMPFLGANCGHRQGELCGVATEDIDFLRKVCGVEYQVKYVDLTDVTDVTVPARAAPLKGNQIVFAPVKNRKSRSGIPVADEMILKLSAHLAAHPATAVTLPFLRADGKVEGDVTRTLVFTNGGRPWYKGTIQRHWDKAWKAAGVPPAKQINGMHVLRHSAASEWLSKGLSLAKAAAYLGDTKEIVLSVYAHFMPADDDLARKIMNGFFERKNAPEMPQADHESKLWLVEAFALQSLTN